MKCTLPRKQIKEAVAGFSKIVNGRTTLPVLGCVRFSANDNSVAAEVTDLDQVVRYRFDAVEIGGDGECIIPLSTLKDLSKGGKSDMIEIEADSPEQVTMINHVGGHAVSQPVTGMDLEEWPPMLTDIPTEPTGGFIETYRRLTPFSSTDQTRYILNSIYVEVGKGANPITMVATDGRRLACWNSMALPVKKSVIIPVTKFLNWNRLPFDIEIGVGEDEGRAWLGVKAGPFFYTVKTVDGTYPNFRQVIPAEPGENVITFVDSDVELLGNLLPSFPGAEDITVVGDAGKVTLHGRGLDDERPTTLTLEDTTYQGDRKFIGINRHYLLDALAAGFREFAINDEFSPLLSRDSDGGTHVLMPMRVEDPEGEGETVAKEAQASAEPVQAEPAEKPATQDEKESVGDDIESKKPKGRRRTMAEKNGTPVPTALDRVLAACETAKGKVVEAGAALTDLAKSVKDAAKENKTQAADLQKARTTLQKLQTMSL